MKDDEIENLDWSGWPLADSHLVELGRVTALWSNVDAFLNVCIAKLARFSEKDPTWFILVNHASFPQRLDMLSTLCEQLHSDYSNLSEYKYTVAALRSAQKERNKFAHNVLGPADQSDDVVMAIGSARGSLQMGLKKAP